MKKPLDHLEEADALAKDHLGMSGIELDLAEAVLEPLRLFAIANYSSGRVR